MQRPHSKIKRPAGAPTNGKDIESLVEWKDLCTPSQVLVQHGLV